MNKILIVDDERDIAELIKDILLDEKYEVLICSSREDGTNKSNIKEDAFAMVKENNIAVILLDIWLVGQNDGIELLEKIKAEGSLKDIEIVMISGHGNIRAAVRAIQCGAYDYIEKPFRTDKLKVIVRNAFESNRMKAKINESNKINDQFIDLIGLCPKINEVRGLALKYAKTNSRILITGDEGSGKELLARFIHKQSAYAGGAFTVITHLHQIVVNNLEIENLTGTIFIDEILQFPIHFQKSLLSFINKLQFDNEKLYNCRIIVSSSVDLEDVDPKNNLHQDLYNRINIIKIHMPNLNERIMDMDDLVDFFVRYFCTISDCTHKKFKFSECALLKLQSFNWFGGVKQLKSMIEWLLLNKNNTMTDNNEIIITSEMLIPEIFSTQASSSPLDVGQLLKMNIKEAKDLFEKYYLQVHLKRAGGSISKAAEIVDMDRSALHRKLKYLNIEVS